MEVLENVKDTAVQWVGNAKETVSDYMGQETIRSRKEAFLIGGILFLMGIIIGFMLSPMKKGITIASNNVNSFGDNEACNNEASAHKRKNN